MANDTEAPTSQFTKDEITNAKGLTEDELAFVTLIHSHWSTHGNILNSEYAKDNYWMEADEYNGYMGSPLVQTAIAERGIISRRAMVTEDERSAKLTNTLVSGDSNNDVSSTDAETPTWKDKALTPHQLLTANVMLDIQDTRSEKKKLQDCGIDSKTWATWMMDPVFGSYLRDRAEALVANSSHDALLALMDKIRGGDLKAIQYYHEFTGRYTQASASSGQTNTEIQDFKGILVNILEIITEEVHDRDVAWAISDRIRGLINMRNTVNELVDDVAIVEPVIKQQRELPAKYAHLRSSDSNGS